MNPWGIKTFDDEIACDWLEDLYDSDPVAFLAQSLDLSDTGDLDYLPCMGVFCAAELVHAKHSQNVERIPKELSQWLEQNTELGLSGFILPALNALRQILTSESELVERWSDNEAAADLWLQHKRELLELLEADFIQRSQVT